MVQLPPHYSVVLLNHQVAIGVVSWVEVCDDTARNAKNPHDCKVLLNKDEDGDNADDTIRALRHWQNVPQFMRRQAWTHVSEGSPLVDLITNVLMVTCAHDGCKHPALSILDWAVTGLSPLSQDVPTSSPQGRIHPFFEVARPVAFQHPPIVLAVDLIMKKEAYVSSHRFRSKLRHLTPLNSWWLFNSCLSCMIYCNNYSVYTRHLLFRVSQKVCFYFNNVQDTVSQFKPQQVFNKQQENSWYWISQFTSGIKRVLSWSLENEAEV